MDDPILESDELNENAVDDDNVAFVRGNTIHKKIIPILLSPKVIFPFAVTHQVVTDPHLKRIFEQTYEEKTVFGYAYHSENAAVPLPPLQHVGVAAIVPELSKLVDGSYLVKIFPLNRFFITEYINADPNDLTARVSYYHDQPEDKKAIRFLADECIRMQGEINKHIREYSDPKVNLNDSIDPNDQTILSLHAYTAFANYPNFTEDEKQHLLWSYKLSERLMILISILDESLPSVKRAVGRMRPFRNN